MGGMAAGGALSLNITCSDGTLTMPLHVGVGGAEEPQVSMITLGVKCADGPPLKFDLLVYS